MLYKCLNAVISNVFILVSFRTKVFLFISYDIAQQDAPIKN
jgi:hypothetical protein